MSNAAKLKRNKSDATECVHCGVEFDKRPWDERRDDPASITVFNHDCEGMKVEHVDVDSHYFACRCRGESRAECDWILDETHRLLKSSHDNTLTNVVYGLEIDYMAHITSIMADQWCGVGATTYPEDAEDTFKVWIQCDRVEDGIAAVYLAFYQHFGPERKRPDA